jgi:cob(I)alamin adenosyltransferase
MNMTKNTPKTPKRDERIVGKQGLGLIQLFEGHGKGKSTAALGEAIRAVGAGLMVAVVYFDKGGSHYFERDCISKYLSEKIDVFGTGRDRIDPVTGRFDFSITDEDKAEGSRGLEEVRRIFTEKQHDLVILDEINSSVDLKIISEDECLKLLKEKPDSMEIVLTGRNAPQSFKDLAHLVTNMELVKHYFYSGVQAREGLDY